MGTIDSSRRVLPECGTTVCVGGHPDSPAYRWGRYDRTRSIGSHINYFRDPIGILWAPGGQRAYLIHFASVTGGDGSRLKIKAVCQEVGPQTGSPPEATSPDQHLAGSLGVQHVGRIKGAHVS